MPPTSRTTVPDVTEIPIRNGWLSRATIRKYNNVTDDWSPYAGTDVRVRLSRFKSGYDFTGMPSTLLGPRTMSAAGVAGVFYAQWTPDEITGALSNLVGQTIYEVIEGDYPSVGYYSITESTPLLVVDPMWAVPEN